MILNKNKWMPQGYVVALWCLTVLFLMRVMGQLVQYSYSLSWLPDLEKWQGSNFPYGYLLFSQLLILALMIYIAIKHTTANIQKNPDKGKWILLFGFLYFSSMGVRLLIGVMGFSSHPWFQKMIPSFFHLILATFILLIAAFHLNWVGRKISHANSEIIQ